MKPVKITLTEKDRRLLKDPVKRRAWIHYQLKSNGNSLAQLARHYGVTRSCLGQVFRITYPKAEKIIAEALGFPPAELWPERYDRDGLPIYRGGPRLLTPPSKQSYQQANRTQQTHG